MTQMISTLCCAIAAFAAPMPSTHPQIGSDTFRIARSAYLMGTTLDLDLTASDRDEALAASEATFDEVRRMEALLSSWRSESELSRLNRSPAGEPQQLSEELYGLLQELDGWVRVTDGTFDPAVGPLVDAWDLRGAGTVPTPGTLAAALQASGWDGFRLLGENGGVRVRPGVWMTAGGFGKGAALRSAYRLLRSRGIEAALLDFGGQLLALGSAPGEAGWRVGVAHPRERGTEIAHLLLRDESAATSGASERFIEVQGARYGHIIDPRTGRPVEAWGSVTVISEDPLVADVLSTALFVMGPEGAKRWLASHAGVEALLLTVRDGGLEAWWTPGLSSRLFSNEQPAFSVLPGGAGKRID